MLERLRKWLALRSYRTRLPYLLVDRYGRQRQYTPPQVLTTIRRHGLSEAYVPYACAMFCSKQAYVDLVASASHTDTSIGPMAESSIPLWAGLDVFHWPAHGDLSVELHDAFDGSHASDFGSHHSDFTSGHSGYDHHDAGGGGHDGGYDGGGGAGGDGSSH